MLRYLSIAADSCAGVTVAKELYPGSFEKLLTLDVFAPPEMDCAIAELICGSMLAVILPIELEIIFEKLIMDDPV